MSRLDTSPFQDTEAFHLSSLRNGAAIHTASALILHLVQTAPANLRSNINAKILEHGKPKLAEDVEMRDSQQEELDADNEDETTTALVSFGARSASNPFADLSFP